MQIICNECNKVICSKEYNEFFCSYWCESRWKKNNPNKKHSIKYSNKGGHMNPMMMQDPTKTIAITLSENNKYMISYSKKEDKSSSMQVYPPRVNVFVADTVEDTTAFISQILYNWKEGM